jgi:RND family efflux transporter MFP subunit
MKYTKTHKRIATITAAISLLLCGILIFSSCSTSSGTTGTTAAAAQKTTVKKGSISNSITATGNLSMPNQAKLTFGSSGTVDQVMVSVGDSVKNGQVLAKLDTVTVSKLKQSLLAAQIKVKQAQMDLEDAKETNLRTTSSTTAANPLTVETKELSLQSAQMNLDNAQKQLDGSTLIATFDGLVAAVNILVGDDVSSSTVAVRLIDPTQLQVDTLVSEMDIFNIKLGGPATIAVTALSDYSLPATVYAISPSATSSSGVVNYTVQLRVSSTQLARAAASGNNTGNAGQLPSGIAGNTTGGTPGSGTGQFTPPSGSGFTPPTGSGQRSSGSTTAASSTTTVIPATLKEGLSVSITITVQQKNDVLLLSSRALSKSGKNTYVNVLKSDGTTEQRQVTIGLADWQNTEITSGLTEGETVVISGTNSTTSTTSTQRQQSGMGSLGGLGGITGGGPR